MELSKAKRGTVEGSGSRLDGCEKAATADLISST